MKNRIGETKIASNGQKMTIIAYRNWYDIDIQFEDGTIVKNKCIDNFKTGQIENPNLTFSEARFGKNYIGTEKVANNGQKMKIISYKNAQDIDVEFEDGTIVKHTRMIQFKRGKIANPNYIIDKTNEEAISLTGLKMKIIRYENTSDVDIEFEDGFKIFHKNYFNFKRGKVGHPSFKINYNNESDDYFGYKVKKSFNINDKVYYEAYKNDEFVALMTLQEIYQSGSEING